MERLRPIWSGSWYWLTNYPGWGLWGNKSTPLIRGWGGFRGMWKWRGNYPKSAILRPWSCPPPLPPTSQLADTRSPSSQTPSQVAVGDMVGGQSQLTDQLCDQLAFRTSDPPEISPASQSASRPSRKKRNSFWQSALPSSSWNSPTRNSLTQQSKYPSEGRAKHNRRPVRRD